MKSIILTHGAARDLGCVPPSARNAVDTALVRYVTTGSGDIKRLAGRDGFRLRVGPYRVIFDEDATTVLAIQIGRRTTTTYRRN